MAVSPGFLQTPKAWNYGTAKAQLALNSEYYILIIPAVVSLISAVILLGNLVYNHFSQLYPKSYTDNSSSNEVDPELIEHLRDQPKATAWIHTKSLHYFYKTGRLLGCLALLSLWLITAFNKHDDPERFCLSFVSVLVLVYTSILAAGSLLFSTWSETLTKHNVLVLFSILGVYAYRDLWPLATYTESPADTAEGTILWAKFFILVLTAVFIPLFTPRKYNPVDPKHPMQSPIPEQMASLFSLWTYGYMNPVILEASKVPHLPHTRLPTLADYDCSGYLTAKAFPHLDPFHEASKKHLFFSLMQIFLREYLIISVLLIMEVGASYLSPIALNRILASLEKGVQDAYVRPWAWVLCLFAGPLVVSICSQAHTYIVTLTMVRARAILTELLFEHSFRIRLKAETSQNGSSVATAGEHKKDNLVGKINTMVTVDVDNVLGARSFIILFLQVPIELIVAITFLYKVLGWSAFVGLASTLLLIPVPGYLGSRLQSIEKRKLERTDARVETVAETIGVLRMIKLFGWEDRMKAILKSKRDDELEWIWKSRMVNLLNRIITSTIPTITMVVTFGVHAGVMGESLTASKIFSSIAVFDMLRGVLTKSSFIFSWTVKGKVSLDRIAHFLRETELLDRYTSDKPNEHCREGDIGFKNAEFTWAEEDESATTQSPSRSFRLRINGELNFRRGCINLIVGPTGAGKTSVLMALLGEMHYIPSSMDSWYNLPREGGVAYAAQESWVQNQTIRENILFGSSYDEIRYQKVINQCALKHDLELFEAGDNTEVGEKGLTLSGGQKARLTLARAVYSSAEILLLDDILAALDVHTAKAVVNDCLKGDLVRGRTIILVTHHVTLTTPISDYIVSVGLDGVARGAGSDISGAISQGIDLEADENDQLENKAETTVGEEVGKNGKLILAEEIEQGRVRWRSIMLYVKGLSGNRPAYFLIIWILGIICTEIARLLSSWFLGFWGSQYENQNPTDVQFSYYLTSYTFIVIAALILSALVSTLYNSATIRASRSVNDQLVESILTSTFRWLDETPLSRIVARCTGDIATVDGSIQNSFYFVVEIMTCMMVQLAIPAVVAPMILGPGLLVAIAGVYVANTYLKAQLSVQREMSNARAPVLAHFGAAMTGLTSIRAYGAQELLKAESLRRIDHYSKIARVSYNLNRWLSIRIDFIGAFFTGGVASYLVSQTNLSSGNIGFALKMVIFFNRLVLYLVMEHNDLEVQANSLERIQSYIDIEHEPKPTQAGKPPAAWPTSGELRVENLSSRYSQDGPIVLKHISFHVKPGQRIGIVGRTGSGKSSLTLSLLRCILTEGKVYFDGLPIDEVNLNELRSHITIIPQMPELLSGTLRRNLDPFGENDDATLNNALRAAGLFSLEAEEEGGRITLDSNISSAGGNLSVGQRQIIALARAIVRNSKLLILDEATSAIDHKTDLIIQSSLRNQLGADVTVLTVAHRLRTIMDADKILVLDSGKMVEFDSPRTLLGLEGGYFKSLVDESDDRESLYKIAEASLDRK
uniref:P-loop containing nucleoside triphosphate hydrolase protein n=1 Tax=Psilocybe cubensis TaxID=181762 RepID=A0A8H8CHL8_PSICU